MPHVNVTVIGNAPTQEQKSALFLKISNLLVTVLGPNRKLTLVSVRTEPATKLVRRRRRSRRRGSCRCRGGNPHGRRKFSGKESADDRGNDDHPAGGFGDSDPAAFLSSWRKSPPNPGAITARRSPNFGRIRTNNTKRRGGVPGRRLMTSGAASHTFGQKDRGDGD